MTMFPTDVILLLLAAILSASSAPIKLPRQYRKKDGVAAAKPGMPPGCAPVRIDIKKPWELRLFCGTMAVRRGSPKAGDNPLFGGRYDEPEQPVWPEQSTAQAPEPAAAGPAVRPAAAPAGPAGPTGSAERGPRQTGSAGSTEQAALIAPS